MNDKMPALPAGDSLSRPCLSRHPSAEAPFISKDCELTLWSVPRFRRPLPAESSRKARSRVRFRPRKRRHLPHLSSIQSGDWEKVIRGLRRSLPQANVSFRPDSRIPGICAGRRKGACGRPNWMTEVRRLPPSRFGRKTKKSGGNVMVFRTPFRPFFMTMIGIRRWNNNSWARCCAPSHALTLAYGITLPEIQAGVAVIGVLAARLIPVAVSQRPCRILEKGDIMPGGSRIDVFGPRF